MRTVTPVLGLLLLTSLCQAESNTFNDNADIYDPGKMPALVAANNTAEAYRYAKKHAVYQEGNPDFDLYFGISAIDTGQVSEGIFALERVLLIYPDDQLTRLELARGYFLLEEYNRAEQEFDTVLANNPSNSVKRTIERYLNAINVQQGRYQMTSSGAIRIGSGNDDNVNNGPADATINIPLLGTATLDPSSQQQEDTFNRLGIEYQLNNPLSAHWSFYLGGDADTRQHSTEEEFDSLLYSVNFGFRAYAGQHRYQLGLVTQQFDLDGEDYRNLNGFNFDWRYRLSAQSLLQVYSQLAVLEYPNQPVRDSQYTAVGSGYTRQFNNSTGTLLFANIYVGAESADQNTEFAKTIAERDILGLNVGTEFNFGSALSLTTSIAMQNSDYQGFDLFFQDKREDEYTQISLKLKWTISKDWTLDTHLSSSQNDSNFDINEYERTEFGVTFAWQFSTG